MSIVYHGGKDGGSGKGLAKKMSQLSTKEHPVIVLSPNMYTMESYKELLEKGRYPIHENRVFVMGVSSGGMGVLSALKEGGKTDSGFRPRVIASLAWFQRELESRKEYREIAATQPGESSKKDLQKLKKDYTGTVYGGHRAQQMLLAHEL